MTDKPKETWKYDPSPLLNSPRKVTGVFHKAIVDKDGEMITPDAIRESIPDYMHLPALHDFHKERPVGLATKVWENSDGSFGFEGVIKATEDCNDVWDKIQKGNYDHVSIFGKREQGNNNCSLPAPLRSGACITTGVRLDSISVCDNNARNDATSLEVRKGIRMVFDADELKKAETTDGELQHASTDYAKEKKCGTKCKIKITVKKSEQRIPPDEKDETDTKTRPAKSGDKKALWAKKPAFDKAVEKADDIDDEDRMEQRGTKTGSTTKEKGAYLPHRETGSEHPKRSKEGYPLKTGGDTAPASHHPAGEKGTAPPVENLTERNSKVELLRERAADKAKETTSESAKKQVNKPKIGRSLGVRKAEDMKKGDEEDGKTEAESCYMGGDQFAACCIGTRRQ